MPSPFRILNHFPTLPPSTGALLLANNIRAVDLKCVEKKIPRPIEWILDESDRDYVSGVAASKIIFCAYDNTEEVVRLASRVLAEGKLAAFARIIETAPTFTGCPKALKKIQAPFVVVPVWVDSMWDKPMEFFADHETRETPQVTFSAPILPGPHWFASAYHALLKLGVDSLERRPETGVSLGYACLHGLKARQNFEIITDVYQKNKTLTCGMLLAISSVLALWIRRNIREQRIGVVLPPGLAGTIVNLACALCGKVPVNLNFTAGRLSNESAIRQAHIKTIITADAMVQKAQDFPWTERREDIATLLKAFPKWKFLLWRSIVLFTPVSRLARMLGVKKNGGNAEAGLLFTSGSSGEPKGVVLTHRNILSNVAQVNAILPTAKVHSMLGSLPIFHSFGFTVTLWWPLISGPRVITYISPLEQSKLAQIVEEHRIALMITTPTFLRGFLRRASARQFKSLKLIVTGAEKLPMKLMNEFETKFQIPVCEGYGMTEATPVISVNLLEDFASSMTVPMRRAGSVGRMLPGIAVKTTSTETGQPQPCFETGVLWYKGPNIFPHYLNDPARTSQVLVDGWYSSGDVGRLDEDGFLYIEGRTSRFSKIGGEMVPHGTIEQHLNEVCAELAPNEDSAHSFVMGISDPAKGESLVALVSSEADVLEIRKKMIQRGLPNLWVPRVIKRVDHIPTLASGKLDLRACHSLVEVTVKEDLKTSDSPTHL